MGYLAQGHEFVDERDHHTIDCRMLCIVEGQWLTRRHGRKSLLIVRLAGHGAENRSQLEGTVMVCIQQDTRAC